MTPMMQQYFEIKDKYREYILMYRLGDFYEMFFDDAKVASAELELTLTGRDCGEAERLPLRWRIRFRPLLRVSVSPV